MSTAVRPTHGPIELEHGPPQAVPGTILGSAELAPTSAIRDEELAS